MTDLLAELALQGLDVREDVLFKEKTSFKIGGPATVMAFPKDAAQLRHTLRACAKARLSPFFLGRGSNLLVKDSGVHRVVVATEKMSVLRRSGDSAIYCEAGVKLSDLCLFALRESLSGLEFAFGIPGSVGGAVFMNAGAYGGEMCQIVRGVWCVGADGQESAVPGDDCKYGYRHSVFMEQQGVCIAAAEFALKKDDSDAIRARMDGFMARRKAKQPLEYPSAGSVFKRPPGQFAGALVERCGLKGKQIGGAQVSEKHANFIVNKGGATAADVRTLIALVQQTVEAQTGFFLLPEIQFL